MKNKFLFLGLLVGVSTISGCNFSQDPMKGRSDYFQRGEPSVPLGKQEPEYNSTSIIIDSLNEFNFKEEREDQFYIGYRVLLPGFTETFEIANMDEFPGAKFDPLEKKFSWNPPLGTTSGNEPTSRVLRVRVYASPIDVNASRPMVLEKSIMVVVNKSPKAPEILSIENVPTEMTEQGEVEIKVKVRDYDAIPTLEGLPYLEIKSTTETWSVVNISSMVKVLNVSPIYNQPHQFVFTVKIDLESEITSDYSNAEFKIAVRSRLGRKSSDQAIRFRVYNLMMEPLTNWEGHKPALFEVDRDNKHQFYIFDPRFEGEVVFNTVTDLPKGATFKCISIKIYSLLCEINWRPTVNDALQGANYRIKYEVTNKNRLDANRTTKGVFFNTISLKQAGSPTSTDEGVQ